MKTFKRILLENLTIIIFVLCSCLIEMVGSAITDGGFYIKDPRYLFTYLGIVVCAMFVIKGQRLRLVILYILLLAQSIVNVIFYLVFEMTGQWFDYSMFLLRNDAMGILESIPINFWHFFGLLIGTSAYLVFGLKMAGYVESKNYKYKKNFIYISDALMLVLIALFAGLNVLTAYSINAAPTDKYENLLNSNVSSKYNQYGMTNNFVNEIYSGTVFNKTTTVSDDEINSYLYENVYIGGSEYSGISKGNNVITILGETLEWTAFMSASACKDNIGMTLPNGTTLTEEECRELYPNLWRFYDNSYIMSNYHAREKTDISENYSILGSYPIESYINYDYYENNSPQSMPNMLRLAYGDNYQAYYFHDGYASYYNREKSIIGVGFDKCYTTEDFIIRDGSTFVDYGSLGERNLDSQMVETCKDLMFPTDKKFYTYITTITTHGMYSKKRENLEKQGYYDKLREYGIDIDDPNISDQAFNYYSYLACALETDKTIGKILDILEERNLLDSTTIVLFGDHNAYYEGVSNYVKGINSPSQSIEDNLNYMDLYRVPLMIYDTKLVNKATNNGENPSGRINTKFASSCDTVPTLLDLLGINYYSNLYYGNSAFSEEESIVYSRAYGYFLSNYAYFYNLNKFTYLNPTIASDPSKKTAYMADLKTRGEVLVRKIKHIDNIFRRDYFGSDETLTLYQDKIKKLNNF